MPGAVIEPGAIVRHAILGEDCTICQGAVVGGAFPEGTQPEISVVQKKARVEANTVLLPGEML
jgi:ADP-glucose pyrophosphorylase